MRVSKILALSLVASLSTASSVIAHETAVPHSKSIHGGPYQITPLIAQEGCLIPGKVGGPVYVKDCQSVPQEYQGWYIFHISRFKQIYNPKTQSCLDVDNKDKVITKKCKKGTLDSERWAIIDKGEAVQIAYGKLCLNYNGSGNVSLLGCDYRTKTHMWNIIDNQQPIPTGGAAKLNLAPKMGSIPLKCDCDCTVQR